MQRFFSRFLLRFFVLLALIGAGAAFIYTQVFPTLLTRPGFVVVEAVPGALAGDVRVIDAGGDIASTLVNPGDSSPVPPGGRVVTQTRASYLLTNTTIDLTPGTDMALIHQFWRPIGGWETALSMSGGQCRIRTGSNGDPLNLVLTVDGATVVINTLAEVVITDEPGTRNISATVLAGEALLKVADSELRLTAGQARSVVAGTIEEGSPMAQVRAPVFSVDGHAAYLPVTLVHQATGTAYTFPADWMVLVPEGAYTLRVDLVTPYILTDLSLTQGTPYDFPVTLSEIVVRLVDENDTVVQDTPLVITGEAPDQQRQIPNGDGLALSSGTWRLLVARAESPTRTQPLDVNIAPGERKVFTLRVDSF